MPHLPDDYKNMAQRIFNDLINEGSPNSIYQNRNYWQVGCVYDTLLDYMQYAVAQKKMTPAGAQAINKAVLDFYGEMDGCWYDDYCWWVIALLKSYTYTSLFYPADITRCRTFIAQAWAIVNIGKPGLQYSGGAARAFDVCDQNVYGSVKPLYPYGTWQYDIYTTRPTIHCDSAHNNPIPVVIDKKMVPPPKLGPYQLSVINGLNMVMTQRMSNNKIIPDQHANQQYSFIQNWTSKNQAAEVNLLNPFDSGGKYGLIRERVGKYQDARVAVTEYDPKYESWAGDQGLFIGGLYDYYLVKRDRNCMDLINKILAGVRAKMAMRFTKNGTTYLALYSWSGGKDPQTGPPGPISSDPADYCSGLGVFMRYLYYCCQDDAIRLPIVNDPAYQTLIRQTADACYDDAYPVVDFEVPMFRQFNRLASFLAAIRILPL